MAASPYRRFSSLCSTVQALVVRLIQEEFTPLITVSAEATETAWFRAVVLVDPTLFYCTAAEPAIRICPESYEQLRTCLPQELTQQQ